MKHLLLLTLLFSLTAQAQQVNDSTYIDLKFPSVLTAAQKHDADIREVLFDQDGNAYQPINDGIDYDMQKIDSAGQIYISPASGYVLFIPTNEGTFNILGLAKFATDRLFGSLPYGSETGYGKIKKGKYRTKISQHTTFRKALDKGYELGGSSNVQKGYFEVWQLPDWIEITQPLIRVE